MADPLVGMTFHFEAPVPPKHDAPRGGLGSQVLPVADLEDDWEGDPEDGAQYLALVRREAATHARINRVANPFETMQTEEVRAEPVAPSSRPSEAWREVFVRNFQEARKRMLAAPIHSLPPVDPAAIPLPRDEGAWRVFINGKRAKAVKPAPPKATASKPPLQSQLAQPPLAPPEASPKEDTQMSDLEAMKAAALASLELDTPEPDEAEPSPPFAPAQPPALALAASSAPAPSLQTPEYERLPQLPSPALLVSIPGPSIIHIFTHLNDWFTERFDAYEEAVHFVPSTIFAPPSLRRKPGGAKPTAAAFPTPVSSSAVKKPPPKPPLPTAHESHWLLSLLTRLERLLDGDDLANLRQLAKTLVQLAEESASKKSVPGAGGGRSMEQRRQDEEDEEARARCWMVVAAIAEVWAQGDLWDTSL
ncbi:hypothetical protein JCM6882_005577 [Rhodosporidiobolus microsporus]